MFVSILAIALAAGCEDGVKGKVQEVQNKVDQGIDKLDKDEVGTHLAAAKNAAGDGKEPHEACSFLQRGTPTDATRGQFDELRKICDFEVPLARASKAVAAAEKARTEQPEAPSFTECSSDEWAQMKTRLDGGAYASDAKWTELKTRWSKVCK